MDIYNIYDLDTTYDLILHSMPYDWLASERSDEPPALRDLPLPRLAERRLRGLRAVAQERVHPVPHGAAARRLRREQAHGGRLEPCGGIQGEVLKDARKDKERKASGGLKVFADASRIRVELEVASYVKVM